MLIECDFNYAGISAITILSAGIGAFIGSYLKKKGENVAIHEDFQIVLSELKVTTQTTKEIENKLADAIWDRQKRWEMKRDTLIDIATKTAECKDILVKLYVIHLKPDNADVNVLLMRQAKQIELGNASNTAFNDLETMVVIASLTCGVEVRTALADFAMFCRNLSLEIIKGHPEAFNTNSDDFATKYNAITIALRKEIGNNEEPMFLADIAAEIQNQTTISQV